MEEEGMENKPLRLQELKRALAEASNSLKKLNEIDQRLKVLDEKLAAAMEAGDRRKAEKLAPKILHALALRDTLLLEATLMNTRHTRLIISCEV